MKNFDTSPVTNHEIYEMLLKVREQNRLILDKLMNLQADVDFMIEGPDDFEYYDDEDEDDYYELDYASDLDKEDR